MKVIREERTHGCAAPAAYLGYRGACRLMMQDVTLATVVGKTVVGGVKYDHLLFREALNKSFVVVPAEAGTQGSQALLDPRLRGDDLNQRLLSRPGVDFQIWIAESLWQST